MPDSLTTAVDALRQAANQSSGLTACLLDDPDCLAEMEHVYSVFRFRYSWGTVYEFSFSELADAHDRKVCFDLMPSAHVYLETIETDTMGRGGHGTLQEVTHRYAVAH